MAAQGLALALGVRPQQGDTAWFSGAQDATTCDPDHAHARAVPRAAALSFDLFLDTEETDLLTLERSSDGGRTWAALPFELRDRGEVDLHRR